MRGLLSISMLVLSFFLLTAFAEKDEISFELTTTVKWMTWEEAIEASQKEKRKVFVDVYTDWCTWCKHMDKNTFSDPVIASYLNENFYPVKFDAEQREPIRFNNKEYKFVKSGRRGYHELALWLMRGRIGYPTVVFLDEDQKIIQPIPSYLPPEKFEPIMTYFGEGYHKKTPWEHYLKSYKRKGVTTSGK